MISRGLVYITYGKESLETAKFSLCSFKKHNPNIPATIFTNVMEQAKEFDNIYEYSADELTDIKYYFEDIYKLRSMKVRFLKFSPYDQTLYLDCDTVIRSNLDEIFSLLDKYDFITTLNAEWNWENKTKISLLNLTSRDIHAINCGVLAYNNNYRMYQLFDAWWNRFVEKTQGDNKHIANITNEQNILQKMSLENFGKNFKINHINIDNKIYNCVASMWPRIHSSGMWDSCKILHSQRLYMNKDLSIDKIYNIDFLQKFK
jgi:hypothetical protein